MNFLAWHFAPLLASRSSGDLAVVLVAEAVAGFCTLVGIPCMRWKKHLAVRLLMRACGTICLLAALLALSAIEPAHDWIFVAPPLSLGVLMFFLARREFKSSGVSE